MGKYLTLSREELDNAKRNSIFITWLFDEVDELNISDIEMGIIFSEQMRYDELIPDEDLFEEMNSYGFESAQELLNCSPVRSTDSDEFCAIAKNLRVDYDDLEIKLRLLIERQKKAEREAKLRLKKENN